MSGARSELKAHYYLIAKLLDGETLDRDRIATLLDVKVAAADGHMGALEAAIPQLVVERDRLRRKTLRLRAESVQREPTKTMAVAASLGAALASLFRGSSYERSLREALEHVLERVKGKTEFKDSDRKFLFVAQGGESALPDNEAELDVIVQGILGNRVVTLRYLDFAGKGMERVIAPLSLAIYQHQLYVLALEETKKTVVRFSRIRDAKVTGKQFKYPSRLEYDPAVTFRNALGIFIKDTPPIPVAHVVVRLDSHWSTYAQYHRWHESHQVETHRDGVDVHMDVGMCAELEQLILSFGEHGEVISPPELKARIADRIRLMAAKLSKRAQSDQPK